MPRAQLHAECYKTQHGCSTTLHMHACHAQIIYGIYSVTDSLARSLAHSFACLLSPLSRARYRVRVRVCVRVRSVRQACGTERKSWENFCGDL